MATEAQIRANRENAKKSTGPTSEAGRGISSQNAVKHRMFALTPVAGPEDEAEYNIFIAALMEQYDPQTSIEYDCIHMMADARWRYLRSCEEERALYNLDYKNYGAADPANYDRGEAFIRLSDSKHLKYSRRCQSMFNRKYEKALAELRRLQVERLRAARQAEEAGELAARNEDDALADLLPGQTKEEVLAQIAAWSATPASPEKIGFVSANPPTPSQS